MIFVFLLAIQSASAMKMRVDPTPELSGQDHVEESAAELMESDSPDFSMPVPVNPTMQPQSVFYAIVMGPLAKRHQIKLWLTSLRQVGGWNGTVVIVTDSKNCIEKTLSDSATSTGISLLGGGKVFSDESLDIYPGLSGQGGGKVHIVQVPRVGCCSEHQIRKMKQHKTRAWVNMAKAKIDHPISSIIYVDEDIVIGDNLSSSHQRPDGGFLAGVRELEKDTTNGGPLLAMFHDIHQETHMNAHTGVVVMFPKDETNACLFKWGKKLMTIAEKKGKSKLLDESTSDAVEQAADMEAELASQMTLEAEVMGPDQRALAATHECKRQGGVRFMPRFLMFPQNSHLKKGYTSTFVHFTNTNRWKSVSAEEKRKFFFEKLKLPKDLDPMGHTKC